MAANALPIRPLGKQGLRAAAQGFGCMSLSKGMYHDADNLGPEEDRIAVIRKALSSGVTLLNTADLYGPYDNHVLIGKAIKDIPRDQVVIASKWGVMKDDKGNYTQDNSAAYARKSLEGSLKRLGIDYIDLYIMRSWDHKTPIEEAIRGMAELVKEGLIKGIGLSEISAADIRKAHAVHPITAIEMEWSLFSRDAEEDLVPTCRELGIAFLAYSPLGRGMLTGAFKMEDLSPTDFRRVGSPRFTKEALEQNEKLVEKIKVLADKKGCKPGQLALAWVQQQGDDVFPIPGTKSIRRLSRTVQWLETGTMASAQGLGCMSLSKGFYHEEQSMGPEEDRMGVIREAMSSGLTLLDTADAYGPYDNQVLIGKAIADVPRGEVLIANKWGFLKDGNTWSQDTSPGYCRKALTTALKNLNTDHIDLYIMRGLDGKTRIEDSVKAMAELVGEGLIKGIGLSEISAADIRKAHAVHPITAVELEWSLFSRDAETDLVPTLRELGIGILAYSPMGRGLLTGMVTLDSMGPNDFRRLSAPHFSEENIHKNLVLVDKLKELAKKKGCKPGQLALAWVHHQGDDVFPIPGTKTLRFLQENIAAFDIKLSKQEMAELEEAVPHAAVAGERYAAMAYTTYHYDETG
ncbi:hypothetical protein WJX82_001619 [Trebouxia sp. C0006]